MEDFCRKLPKIELHAHLNGSLSPETLKKLNCLNENIDEYQSLTKLLTRTDKTLQQCFPLFEIARKATSTIDSTFLATKEVIQDFRNDNVIYLELRTTPRHEKRMTKFQYIESVIKGILDESDKSIVVKLLLSIDRSHDLETCQRALDMIIKMKTHYPDIIKGIDLCGNPSIGEFNLELFQMARNESLKIVLHCGEIKNDKEVINMLNFQPDRIGHGTCLHPNYGGSNEIWQLYQQYRIPTECCLTSNIICGTVENYRKHHINEWIKNSLPYTIGTDDKGVFCTDLSNEYLQCADNFNLNKDELLKISYNSIDYCFASKQEKVGLFGKLDDWKLNESSS